MEINEIKKLTELMSKSGLSRVERERNFKRQIEIYVDEFLKEMREIKGGV